LASEARDWLEGDGETATLSEYVEKKSGLAAIVSPVQFRMAEVQAREEAAASCLQILNLTRSFLTNLSSTHNVTEEEVQAALTLANSAEDWIAKKLDDQNKLELFKDPLVTSEQIKAKCEPVQKSATILIRRPRKKPPPPPVNVTLNTTATEDNGAENNENQKENDSEGAKQKEGKEETKKDL